MNEFCPKLRPVKTSRALWRGQDVLVLEDPLGVSGSRLVVGRGIVPLLGLCDGTRDLSGLRSSFMLRTGLQILLRDVNDLVQKLDEALLLENDRSRAAIGAAVEAFRAAPCRRPALAGATYPADPAELTATFDAYVREAGPPTPVDGGEIMGIVSPHIDYERGWKTYAQVWQAAAEAVRAADIVVVFGTDHTGSPGTLTLTRQNYSTPWGTLPTDVALADSVAAALGEECAFEDELHHVNEHSIELATVWLHYAAGGKPVPVLPVLCGPHEGLLAGNGADARRVWGALDALREGTAGRRALVVAAGDLSHVGPAFDDPAPLDSAAKAQLRQTDAAWLEAACSGDHRRLGEHMVKAGDPTRVCGAGCVYYMLRLIEGTRGHLLCYDQCPADAGAGSIVSIAGVLFTR